MIESNFKLVKRMMDDEQFGSALLDKLFERLWQVMREGAPEAEADADL